MDKARLAVVAVGGNALTLPTGSGTIGEQLLHARGVASGVITLLERGWRVLITHGNGPQVGLAVRRARLARAADPGLPPARLDECVAETQGSLGYVLMTAIGDALAAVARQETLVTLVTRAVVSPDDPAFARPTKPIDIGTNRQLVPSPKPLRILELHAISALLQARHVVIAGGGGGIPVVRDAVGRFRGVAAVIDKDYTSSLLAIDLDADFMVACTSVGRVAVGFGTAAQRDLDELDATEAERLLAAGEFPSGSMGPKIEAALRFLQAAPQRARSVLITTPDLLGDALAGRAGTRVIPTKQAHVLEELT